MTTTTMKPLPHACALSGHVARSPWARIERLVRAWHARARQRRQLAALPPRLLDDLGLSAQDARSEAAKPFWRG